MKFKKLQRSSLIEGGWRLATVEEAQENVDSIKHLLEKWDRERLLDGWIGGSTYDFHSEVGFRSCVGYMLLVKSPPPDQLSTTDGSVKYRYSEVTLSEEGMRAALFLCTEDWNYEVVCWLLQCWSKGKIEQLIAWESIENYELVDASKRVSALAIEMQFVHSISQVSRSLEQASRSRLSATAMEDLLSIFLKFVTERSNIPSLKEVLSSINPREADKEYCRQMRLTEDLESFQTFGFDMMAEDTQQAIADTICHVVIDAMLIRIVREWVITENGESLPDVVRFANQLLNQTFFENDGLGRIVQGAADTAKDDLESFKKILRDQGYGTFTSNGRYSFLNTILVEAAKKGNVNLVETLINYGVDPLETDDTKRKTALHHAVKWKNETLAEECLLRMAINETLANVPDYKQRTPLHEAASCGHASICRLLIKHKASLSAKDTNGQIPLHYALSREKQNEEVVRVLFKENSSDVGAEDSDGRTPLDYAVKNQGENVKMVIDLLLERGQPGDYLKKLDLASYLREASRGGHLDLVKILKAKEAKPLERDKEGKTALHYAAEGSDDKKALDIVHELVVNEYKQVSNVELVTGCDKYGRSVLHIAASSGHRKLCEWLLNLDVTDVDSRDRDGRSALYYAAGCKIDDAQLLDFWRRRSYDLTDFKGTTPLHVAAAKGNFRIIEKILSQVTLQHRKTVVRAADVFGQTALQKAASGGHTQVVGKLLTEGAHPLSERDCDGKTALHYAVQAKNVPDGMKIAELLLKSCGSDQVRFLLLSAFAFGTGFAEESYGCDHKLKEYIHKEKNKILEPTGRRELFTVAAILGDEQMENKLLPKDIKIDHIRSYEFRDPVTPQDKQNVQKVQDEIDNINNFVEQDTDKPALHDNLGRSAFVNGLASLFLNPSVSSPITVGISGEWGMGKSSVMLQVESILLKTAAHLTVSSSLRKQDFPGTNNSKSFGCGEFKCKTIIGIVENLVKGLFYKAKNLVKGLFGTSENNIQTCHLKVLSDILSTYQLEHRQVFKSLAIAERRDMIQVESKKKEEKSIRANKMKGIIPSIFTVRYNAWQYRNETEAWAGLGVEIIKEFEAAMTVAHRLSSSWRYNWASRKRTICVEVFLPCFLAVTVAIWVTVTLWFLLDRVKDRHLKDFKYASLPITLIAVSWAGVKSVMSVVKPISSHVVDYLSFPDHSKKLGYHQQVIDDINFLKNELSHKPSVLWCSLALIWCWTPFCSWENHFPKTTIPKMTPASKDNMRMVVFVDDLDRCQEKVILQILSAINLVLSVCEINVVMAMDKSMIEKAIERFYGGKQNKSGQEFADTYLRKIIQLPLDLPDPSQIDYNFFLQCQLGRSATKKPATDAEPETGEFNPMSRKGTFTKRNSGIGKTKASLEVTGVREARHPNSGGSTEITIGGEDKDSGGHQTWMQACVKKLISFLPCKQQETIHNEEEWMKIFSTTIDLEKLKRQYSPAESDAFCFLHGRVTGSRKLPREWKRLKNYHRVVWTVLSTSPELKTLQGWQVQLIAWVFICWQWKDQINTLIQGWHELSVYKKDDPWLRDIVEDYIDQRWPSHKISSRIHDRLNANNNESTEVKSEEVGEGKAYEEQVSRGKEDEQKHKAPDKNTGKTKVDKEEEKQKEWKNLRETLKRYNVSIRGVLAFQDFRFYCTPRNLGWQ